MKEELDEFNINIDDLKVSINLFDNIEEAIQKMKMETLKDRFEVVLNNNLIEFKEKFTNFRTILGCRVSYDNLNKDIFFIVREDTKPTYEELENQLQQKENIIKEVRDILRKHICNPSGLKDGWHIDCWNNEDISKLNEDLGILDKANDREDK